MKKMIQENAIGITRSNRAPERTKIYIKKPCNWLNNLKKWFERHILPGFSSVALLLRVSKGFVCSVAVSVLLLGYMGAGLLYAADKWPGVDDAVVNRIAREHGREEKPSLIPAAEGDLQLFLFLMAGAVGGFAAGYYWRVLLENKQKRPPHQP